MPTSTQLHHLAARLTAAEAVATAAAILTNHQQLWETVHAAAMAVDGEDVAIDDVAGDAAAAARTVDLLDALDAAVRAWRAEAYIGLPQPPEAPKLPRHRTRARQ